MMNSWRRVNSGCENMPGNVGAVSTTPPFAAHLADLLFSRDAAISSTVRPEYKRQLSFSLLVPAGYFLCTPSQLSHAPPHTQRLATLLLLVTARFTLHTQYHKPTTAYTLHLLCSNPFYFNLLYRVSDNPSGKKEPSTSASVSAANMSDVEANATPTKPSSAWTEEAKVRRSTLSSHRTFVFSFPYPPIQP